MSGFRKSVFESVPGFIPLAIAALLLCGGAWQFTQEVLPNDLPVHYAKTALFVSCSAIAYSFYVCFLLFKILIWILGEKTGNDKMNEVSMTIL